MNDDRADRLRQQELIRRADAFEQTEAARDGFLRRFEREADPQGVLGEEERVARAVALRAEYMRKLAARSARVRFERALRLRVADRGRDPAVERALSEVATRPDVVDRRGPVDGRQGNVGRGERGLYGRWRLTRVDLWDQYDHYPLGGGLLVLGEDGSGTMAFEVVVMSLDHRVAECGDRRAVEFSWDGSDHRRAASGRGWIVAAKRDHVVGHIYFHRGVDSAFAAVRE